MKAISIKQPWASLIAHGIKDIENRTWKIKFRGRVFIHASSVAKGCLSLLNNVQVNDLRSKSNLEFDLPTSAIIGEVDIIDCVTHHPSPWAEVQIGEGKPIHNWVLANAVLYDKPILNVKGKLSFWEPDIDIEECIGCSGKFISEEMEEDSANEKYCAECWEIFAPILAKEAKENDLKINS